MGTREDLSESRLRQLPGALFPSELRVLRLRFYSRFGEVVGGWVERWLVNVGWSLPCFFFWKWRHRFIIIFCCEFGMFPFFWKENWLLKEFNCSNLKWKCVEVGNLRLFMTFLVMSFGSHEGGEIYSLAGLVNQVHFTTLYGRSILWFHVSQVGTRISCNTTSGCSFFSRRCCGVVVLTNLSAGVGLTAFQKAFLSQERRGRNWKITRGVEIALSWHLGVHCDFENFFMFFVVYSNLKGLFGDVDLERISIYHSPSDEKKVLRSKLLIEHDWSCNLLLHPKLRMPVVLFTSHICCVYIYIYVHSL